MHSEFYNFESQPWGKASVQRKTHCLHQPLKVSHERSVLVIFAWPACGPLDCRVCFQFRQHSTQLRLCPPRRTLPLDSQRRRHKPLQLGGLVPDLRCGTDRRLCSSLFWRRRRGGGCKTLASFAPVKDACTCTAGGCRVEPLILRWQRRCGRVAFARGCLLLRMRDARWRKRARRRRALLPWHSEPRRQTPAAKPRRRRRQTSWPPSRGSSGSSGSSCMSHPRRKSGRRPRPSNANAATRWRPKPWWQHSGWQHSGPCHAWRQPRWWTRTTQAGRTSRTTATHHHHQWRPAWRGAWRGASAATTTATAAAAEVIVRFIIGHGNVFR